MNTRIIDFAKKEKINANLFEIYEIKVKVSVNFQTEAFFKIVSTAFNNRSYRVKVPLNHPDAIVKVMFTHLGEDQEIKLIPLQDCKVEKESTLKVDVIGKRKNLKNITIADSSEEKLTLYCNLSGIALSHNRSNKQINNYIVEPIASNKFFDVELNKFLGAKNKISSELMRGVSSYNTAYYTLDYNQNLSRQYELTNNYKKACDTFLTLQKQKENKLTYLEENMRVKAITIYRSNDSSVQITSGTRDDSDPKHFTEMQLAPNEGYFCDSHPFVNVTEVSPDRSIEEKNIFSGVGNANFSVYQSYPFTNYEKIYSGKEGNKLVEQTKKLLKGFKNKKKNFNTYKIEVSCCALPNVVKDIAELPVSKLNTTVQVFPSDEYGTFFESLQSDEIKIEAILQDKKKSKFYLAPIQNMPSCVKTEKEKKENSTVIPPDAYTFYSDLTILNLSKGEEKKDQYHIKKEFKKVNDYFEYLNNKKERQTQYDAALLLYRNGKSLFVSEKHRAIASYLDALKQKLQTAFLNVVSMSYFRNHTFEFCIDVFKGNFLEKWGFKEFLDNSVFPWKKIDSNLDVFNYHIKSEFVSFWGKGSNIFRGVVNILSSGKLSFIDECEKSSLDPSYKYYKRKPEESFEISLHKILSDDNSVVSGQVKKHFIEGITSYSYQIEERGGAFEYQIRMPGIASEIEHKVPVFKTSVYDKVFVRNYIGGENIEGNIFPDFYFNSWIAEQTNYEITYGKIFRLSNIVKESIFYLYYLQNQVLSSRLWCETSNISGARNLEKWKETIKYPEFNSDGMLVHTPIEENVTCPELSNENKLWHLFLDGVVREIMLDEVSSDSMGKCYEYLKNCEGNFILEKKEDLKIGKGIFNFTLLVVFLTNFLENKLQNLFSIMNTLETEYKNMLELSNDEKVKESANLYEKTQQEAKKRFEKVCKDLEIPKAEKMFSPEEINDIKSILAKLGTANNLNFEDLEKFCASLAFISDILEECINNRSYWLTHKNRPMKIHWNP